jgi:pimeloyl-ACP methyl ester carboxylesterase
MGDNPHIFDDLAPALTDRFRVIAYARRGHGRSTQKGPYSTLTLTRDLRGLLDRLGIARASLVGASMGGNEVTGMATYYPDRVDRIVYLDGGYDWADPSCRKAIRAIAMASDLPKSIFDSLDHYRAFWKSAIPGIRPFSRLEASIRESVIVRPDGTVRFRTREAEFLRVRRALFTYRRDYARVRAPALSIYAASFANPRAFPRAQEAKVREWELESWAPFQKRSIAKIRRELKHVRVAQVPGSHGDFFFSSRARVVRLLRNFLVPTEVTRAHSR